MVSEAEFVLLGDEPTTVDVGGTEVALLKPAGRRGMRRRVAVDVNARRPRSRLAIVAVAALIGVGAVVIVAVIMRRRAKAAAAAHERVPSTPESAEQLSHLEPVDVGTFTG